MIRQLNKKRRGEIATFTLVYLILFLLVIAAFALQIRQYLALKSDTEDALAASNLATAVVDIQEYGISHNLIVADPDNAYRIFQDTIRVNLNLTDTWMDSTGRISGPVTVEQYVIYNVRGQDVEVYSYGPGVTYASVVNGGIGSLTAPNGRTIESTSIYSRISYHVAGYFGTDVPAVKDNLVDIVGR